MLCGGKVTSEAPHCQPPSTDQLLPGQASTPLGPLWDRRWASLSLVLSDLPPFTQTGLTESLWFSYFLQRTPVALKLENKERSSSPS